MKHRPSVITSESALVRWLLVGAAVAFLAVFLLVPLVSVFAQALRLGLAAYARAITEPQTLHAAKLTLTAAAVAVPLNAAFGLCAAWLIARFRFPGKGALLALIDLPFSVSPVVAGMMLVLLLGRQGWLGPWLLSHGIRVIFAVPGIVIATVFVTLPLVVREVLPVLQARGSQEEEAALTLGASGWRMFVQVTLPKIRWGVLYGVVLCTARAMGEFGAVSVVSGHVRGVTNTLPLHAEVLYNDYNMTGAFAVASLLTLLAVATLLLKKFVEWRARTP